MSNWPITGSLWLSCLTFSVISCEWCSECSLSRNILCCSELARRQVSHVDNVQEEIPGQERTRATSWGNNMWLLIEMKKEWDVPLWRQRGSVCPDWSSWSWEDESTDFSDLLTNSTNRVTFSLTHWNVLTTIGKTVSWGAGATKIYSILSTIPENKCPDYTLC